MHPTCYCCWLANSFSQFWPQDACASVDVLNLFDNLNCIALLDWLVYCIYPPSTMSTSYCHSLHLPINLCIIALYWLVLTCIIALYCVFAYTPQSTVSTGFTLLLTHMSACVIDIFLAGRTIYLYWYCVLLLAYCHWHWHLLLIICLLPQLLRAVARALHGPKISSPARPGPKNFGPARPARLQKNIGPARPGPVNEKPGPAWPDPVSRTQTKTQLWILQIIIKPVYWV